MLLIAQGNWMHEEANFCSLMENNKLILCKIFIEIFQGLRFKTGLAGPFAQNAKAKKLFSIDQVSIRRVLTANLWFNNANANVENLTLRHWKFSAIKYFVVFQTSETRSSRFLLVKVRFNAFQHLFYLLSLQLVQIKLQIREVIEVQQSDENVWIPGKSI